MNTGTILLACLVSAATSFAVAYFVVPQPAAASAPTSDTSLLDRRLDDLERRLEVLGNASAPRSLEARQELPAFDDASIERAVRAWLDRNRGDLAPALAEAAAKGAEPAKTFDPAATASQLWKLEWEAQAQRWQELSAQERDALVAHIESLAKSHPNDADLQVRLGEAYVQKILAPGTGFMEMAKFGQAADRQFTKALELDDHHWDARFNKAMGLAHQPAVLGGRPKAIEHLEILLQQQEQLAPETKHAGAYLVLGNLWAEQGNQDKAREIWERGRKRHPNSRELSDRLKD